MSGRAAFPVHAASSNLFPGQAVTPPERGPLRFDFDRSLHPGWSDSAFWNRFKPPGMRPS